MTAIVVLGMHRSGTSCLAGMLAAGGLASAGDAVRNWDNARGHHEMLGAVRLNEAVLAHSGGHWLAPPREVRWTDEHAAARDQLLGMSPPALIKDPRTLLTLPFWRASAVPFHAIAVVRHPLAVARSLAAWREMPLADGVALWLAHGRALAGSGAPILDFEAPREAFVSSVVAVCRAWGRDFDEVALAAAYEEQLVHHDAGDAPEVPGLSEAVALYRALAARSDGVVGAADESMSAFSSRVAAREVAAPIDAAPDERAAGADADAAGEGRARRPFPRGAMSAFSSRLAARDVAGAIAAARDALADVTDAAGALVPIVTALVRARAYPEARALIAEHATRLDDGLVDLLHGKVLLAAGDSTAAVAHLEAAAAVPQPFFQSRHLLAQALRGAGRFHDARTTLRAVADAALYPHGPLATLAEWRWLDGEPVAALSEMAAAIDAAPLHRRGRLRTRRAAWLLAANDTAAARAELERAIAEDPAYPRAAAMLATLG